MERPFRSVAPRRPRWNARRCRWTMRIVCLHWARSTRSVDKVEKSLSQCVAPWNPARARLVTSIPDDSLTARCHSGARWASLQCGILAGLSTGMGHQRSRCSRPRDHACPLRSESDHRRSNYDAPLCAKSDRTQCSKIRAYSITSSASASSFGGMSRPSAFAVLRLTASWKRVGCRTGRSAGLSPLRMRPA